MFLSRIKLVNWKNFQHVDVELSPRIFLIGPNSSGKSNFLDVFRFLYDIAKDGGGLQKALYDRGGMKKIRCLSARQSPNVVIECEMRDHSDVWTYTLEIKKESTGTHRTFVEKEIVKKNDNLILNRPTEDDKADLLKLTQTHLEQIQSNSDFREIYNYFRDFYYLHIVPQLLSHAQLFSTSLGKKEDPFGFHFLEKIAGMDLRTQKSRLNKIQKLLEKAVPQFSKLSLIKDENGRPHLQAIYEHWRGHGAKQNEDQFSDGTLRLIGLAWAILESHSLLLLEEPELSLHSAIVRELPALLYFINESKKKKSQIFISTHSIDLLSDKGISAKEILILKPGLNGTEIQSAHIIDEIRTLMENGMSAAEAVLPLSAPEKISGFMDAL